MSDDRWVKLEGADNVRDVGGLPVAGGRLVRFGQLMRAATLHGLTIADVEYLTSTFGVHTVIDLRTPREVERDGPTPLARAGVRTVALSLIAESRPPLPLTGDDSDPLLAHYLGYLSERGENVIEAIRLIAAPDAGPAVVHCAAGKDRTGVLVALILDAVGVERDAVVADYVLSAEALEPMFRRRLAAFPDAELVDLQPHMPRAEVMAEVLATLDRRHGGAAGWMHEAGLDAAAVTRLQDRLVA